METEQLKHRYCKSVGLLQDPICDTLTPLPSDANHSIVIFEVSMKSRLVLSAILFGCVIQCSAQSQSPLLTEVTSSDGSANDTFGSSVSVQGNTMVVGAPSANVAGSQYRPGAAYVFTRTGSTWMQVAKLTPSDLGDDDFGASVAIGGSVIAVGGPKKNPNKLGGVYVFVQPQGGWTDATETALLNAGDLLVHGIGTHVAITAS